VPATHSVAVVIEQGRTRCFACAVDWPGWARSAKGDEAAALEALAGYAPRYSRALQRAGIDPPRARGAADLDVVERIAGNATTDFGAPSLVMAADRQPLSAAQARRLAGLMAAGWAELDAVAAASPASLRKGPRGGGRDRDAVVSHVVEAERSYARKLDVRLTVAEWRDGGVELMRARLLDAVARSSDGSAPVERGWPPRYLVRRLAWHVLDHAWEIEDRATP
jgi:hypothetical protein